MYLNLVWSVGVRLSKDRRTEERKEGRKEDDAALWDCSTVEC